MCEIGKNTSRYAAAACGVLASPDGAKTPQAHAAVADEVGFRAATAAGRESYEFSVQGAAVDRGTGRLAGFIG